MEQPGTQTRIDAPVGLAGKELRDDLFLERLEGLRVAEETGDADQQSRKSASTSAGVCCK